MLNGYKTYIGLAITFLGILGYADIVTEAQVAELVNLVTQIIGIVVAMYGRWHATYRANKK